MLQALLVFVPPLLMLLLSQGAVRADDVAAPMEEGERRALYSAIQGFVGRNWNGSELFPDPCGWTPIQVPVALHLRSSLRSSPSKAVSKTSGSRSSIQFFPTRV